MVIQDKFALGTLSGFLSTIPQLLFNILSVRFGFSKLYDFQLSAGIFILKDYTLTSGGIFLGTVSWLFTAFFLATIVYYILSWSGPDFWWLKGPIITTILMFTFVHGVLFTIGASHVNPNDPNTNISLFLDNLIFGSLTAYLIYRWGVFPNRKTS